MVDPKKWNSEKRRDFWIDFEEELVLELGRNDGEREKQSSRRGEEASDSIIILF